MLPVERCLHLELAPAPPRCRRASPGCGARAGGTPGAHPRAHSAPCAPPGLLPASGTNQRKSPITSVAGRGGAVPGSPRGDPRPLPVLPGPARPLPGSPARCPARLSRRPRSAFVWEAARPGHGRALPARRRNFPKSFFFPGSDGGCGSGEKGRGARGAHP